MLNLSSVTELFYSDHFVLPLPEGHKFPMAKYSRLRERILAEGIVAPADLHEAPLASLGRPAAGPHAGLCRRRRERHGAARRSSGASAFPGRRRWSNARADRSARRSPPPAPRSMTAWPPTWPAARITRSPIAAKATASSTTSPSPRACCSAISTPAASPIVDLDVHQGNGTAAIFSDDPSVFTFSMHGDKNFPFRKEVSDLDVPLADGTGDDEYLALLRTHLPDVLNRHQPDFVFYLAGADPYEGDRLGPAEADHRRTAAPRRDRHGARAAARGLPVAISMSGGYAHDIDAIVTIHANTIRTAAAKEQWLNTFVS